MTKMRFYIEMNKTFVIVASSIMLSCSFSNPNTHLVRKWKTHNDYFIGKWETTNEYCHGETIFKDDKIFEAKLKVNSDEWGFVSFPEDFSTSASDGEYEWECTVGDRAVSSGSFTFRLDQRELTLPKK